MKKFFALVLAVAMVMSMASVAFAADVLTLSLAGDYGADSNKFSEGAALEYGDTVYFALSDAEGYLSEYKEVEKLKVKVKYEMGEDLVESVSVVKKYVECFGGHSENEDCDCVEDYYYFIAVKTAKKQTTVDADIIGTFEFNRKADTKKSIDKIDDEEHDFEINLWYDYDWMDVTDTGNTADTKDDVKMWYVEGKSDVELKWDTEYALKFNYDDEVDFTFGYDSMNEGTFTVDVSGQGKLFVMYDTKAVDAIVDANPGVKMHFVNFNGAKFNRTGEFAYEMEDGVAAYKVVDGALVAIPGCEYDEADEAFYFNTRVLEKYVFANAELVNPVAEAPVVEAPVAAPSNPSTGA